MILNIRHRGLARFWVSGDRRGLPVPHADRVRYLLGLLHSSQRPSDMNLPGLRWHPLGEMAPGRYSVRVTANWRLTFAFDGSDAVDVDMEDYH